MKKFALCAAVAAAGLAGSVQAQNLLNNGGFEDAVGFDFSDPSNWNAFFGGPAGTFLQAFNTVGAPAHSGNQALELTIQGVLDEADPHFDGNLTTGFDAFTGHVQTVTGLTAGTEYEFAIWAASLNGATSNGAEYRIEWQDAMGAEISRTNVEFQADLTSDYQRLSFTDVAPTGATQAALVIAVQSFTNDGVAANIDIAIDDASFTAVPTPATAALLGLGGLATARRRR